VTETRFTELDTERMKRVIDRLDKMGVAVISVSGGGEPLLRPDLEEIIDYAAALGLYTKVTSNGTMPHARYERLLKSRVDEIGISLDGVRGSDLPFSHVGPPILSALQHLNDNLPVSKKLTINVTVSEANHSEVQDIVEYCAERYPRARVWLNPVVVGDGALRTSKVSKTKPDYLNDCHSPTLLSAKFYTAAAEELYRRDRFNWRCLAGDQFFDVKPNGDFWLCQDQPSPVRLNVLEPDFEEKRKYLNKDVRSRCPGCVYSCYYLVQNSFYRRNWRDVALLWWAARTEPGGTERRVAERFGWLAGLLSLIFPRLASRTIAALGCLAALIIPFAVLLAAAAPGELAETELIERLEDTGRRQREVLQKWTSVRTYTASNQRLNKSARVRIRMEYTAPGQKTYSLLEKSGSPLIIKRVIYPIIDAECQNAVAEVRALSDINRSNYHMRLLGFGTDEQAYRFEVSPRVPQRYQFRGTIWVDAATFGITQIRGVPARKPSFWVKSSEFSHKYGQFNGFWLPVVHHSEAQLRLFGKSTLDIVYEEYQLPPRESSAFRKHVLVLAVADHQRSLAGPLADHEFEAPRGRVDGDERYRAVIVLARCDRALPFAEIECRPAAVLAYVDLAQSGARVVRRQLGDRGRISGNHQPLALFRECGLVVCCRRVHVAHRLRLAVEQHLQQTAHQRA
jgi:MoaA/NifB/PqqE/SkfB family radical SAM enzyme